MALAIISEYASEYDSSVDVYQNRWNDYRFAYVYQAFARLMLRTPKFRVRDEFEGASGQVPAQTGVYVALDDPYASLQFVWSGNDGIQLRMANTLNQIGIDALSSVGRKSLWLFRRLSKVDCLAVLPLAIVSLKLATISPHLYLIVDGFFLRTRLRQVSTHLMGIHSGSGTRISIGEVMHWGCSFAL